MKRVGFIFIALIICLGITISGCSSAQKKLSEDVKGIKTKVETLETRVEGVEAKQTESERLVMERVQRVEEMKSERIRPSARTNIEVKEKRSRKDRERIREIQTCLKNAGLYHGEIDGVNGKKTRAAIRKFQTENGLVADGVVGRKTWEYLSKYSSGAQAAAVAVDEEASAK